MKNYLRDLALADIIGTKDQAVIYAAEISGVYTTNINDAFDNLIDELGYDTFDDLMEDITDVENYSDEVSFTIAGQITVKLFKEEEYEGWDDWKADAEFEERFYREYNDIF